MLVRDQIIESARSLIDVPFVEKGRTNRGIDCVGLLLHVAHAIGQDDIIDILDYSMAPEVEKFMEYVVGQTDEAPKNPLMHGSIVLLRQAIYPMHCGLLTTDKGRIQLIHAAPSRGVCETLYKPWSRNFLKQRNFRGVI